MWLECPLCNFHLSFVNIVVALMVTGNCLSGRDWYVVIPLGTIICLPEGEAGMGGVYFAAFILCKFTVFFVVVVVKLVVFGNHLSEKDGQVAIPLGTMICVLTGGAGVG